MKQRDKYGDRETPLIEDVNAIKSLENDYAQILYKPQKKYTPTSELLFDRLQKCFYELGTEEFPYTDSFDYFEYALSLLYLKQIEGNWFPLGRFGWRTKSGYRRETAITRKEKEASEKKEEFELVNSFLFENYAEFEKNHAIIMSQLKEMRFF